MHDRKINTAGSFLEAVFGKILYVEDLPAEETTPQVADIRRRALVVAELLTKVVDNLRGEWGMSPRVRELAVLLWDLIGHRVTPAAVTPVKALSFIAEGSSKAIPLGTILVPWSWDAMVQADPIMQFGGVVNIGSQARDYYNKKITFDDHVPVQQRALAFEVEFLNSVKKLAEGWTPNEYQATIMGKFPHGLGSLDPALWYESKPYGGEHGR